MKWVILDRSEATWDFGRMEWATGETPLLVTLNCEKSSATARPSRIESTTH